MEIGEHFLMLSAQEVQALLQVLGALLGIQSIGQVEFPTEDAHYPAITGVFSRKLPLENYRLSTAIHQESNTCVCITMVELYWK